MARNRYLPFGYMLENGEIVISASEAQCVKEAYEAYADGASYTSIAETLQATGIRYHKDTPLWNKHMVKRMLENARYTGKGDYPVIVQPDIFRHAAALREQRAPKRKKKNLQSVSSHPLTSFDISACITDINIVRLENQINQELSRPVLEPERLKEMIFRCASQKYKVIWEANNQIHSNQMDAGSVHFDI